MARRATAPGRIIVLQVVVLAVATTAALVVPLWTGVIDGGLVQP